MVSFVIAAYNEEKNIRNCVSEILGTDLCYEIIIIDDGSSDSTLNICQKLAENDTRVQVYHQENAGVSAARNAGIMKAKGEWIVFSDADDIILPESVVLYDRYSEEEYDVIQTCHMYSNQQFRGNNSVEEKKPEEIIKILFNRYKYIEQVPMEKKQIVDSVHGVYNKAFSRRLIMNSGIRFLDGLGLGEDLLFYVDILKNADRILWVNSLTYIIHRNPFSSTRRFNRKMIEYAIAFAEIARDRVDSSNDSELHYNVMYQIYFTAYCGVFRNVTENNSDMPFGERFQAVSRVLDNNIISESVKYLDAEIARGNKGALSVNELLTIKLLCKKKIKTFLFLRALYVKLTHLLRGKKTDG